MTEGPFLTNLEQEIADIEHRLAEKKAVLQQSQSETAKPEKEILHEVVSEKAQEFVPSYRPNAEIGSGPDRDTAKGADVKDQFNIGIGTAEPPSYLSDELKVKVQDLVNLAFNKGLAEAVKEVSKMNNAALLDAFHDVLVDQLYDVLVERGKLEKI